MEAHVQEPVPGTNGTGEVGAAVEALQWAETMAHTGDFSLAVSWLDRADELLGGLTPRYQRRRRVWQTAAAG
jgi:hypothetical protein